MVLGCYFFTGIVPKKYYTIAYKNSYDTSTLPAQYIVDLDVDDEKDIIPLEKPVNIMSERPVWLKRMAKLIQYFLDRDKNENEKKKVYKSYTDIVYGGSKNTILYPRRTECVRYILDQKDLTNICKKFGLKGISYKGDDNVYSNLQDDQYNRNYVIWDKDCIKIINKKTKETNYAWLNDKVPDFFKTKALEWDKGTGEQSKINADRDKKERKIKILGQPQITRGENNRAKYSKNRYTEKDGKKSIVKSEYRPWIYED